MLKIEVKGSIEKALRELKRKFDKTKVVKELRERQAFVKPSVKRRDEIRKAQYIEFVRSEEEKTKNS